jgi:opacity protein-like surface antigen
MSKQLRIILLNAALFSSSAFASPLQGLYLGLGANSSKLELDQAMNFDADKVESIPLHFNAEHGLYSRFNPQAFVGYGFKLNNYYASLELNADLKAKSWDIRQSDYMAHIQRSKSYGASVRLGYTVTPRVLIYGIAGLTQTSYIGQVNFIPGGEFNRGNINLNNSPELDTGKLTGKQVGAGLAVAISKNLSIKAEYQHIRYNDTMNYALNNSKYTFYNPIGQGSINFASEDSIGLGLSFQLDKP